jgi:hypothetical protein
MASFEPVAKLSILQHTKALGKTHTSIFSTHADTLVLLRKESQDLCHAMAAT